jgi:Peptidase family M23
MGPSARFSMPWLMALLFAGAAMVGCSSEEGDELWDEGPPAGDEGEAVGEESSALGASPSFQLPFPCNQVWSGQTRANHSPQNSVDFNRANDEGDVVVAAAAGTVSRVENLGNRSYGRWIEINHGGGWTTRYAHLSAQTVKVGQKVVSGQKIGNVGNTGGSTGAHLHYEARSNGVAVRTKFNGSPVTYFGTKNYASHNACGGTGGGGGGGATGKCVAGSNYCGGDKVVGDSRSLYRCNADGSGTLIAKCGNGCRVNLGNDDTCKAPLPCTVGGSYCGGDKVNGDPSVLYRCGANGTTSVIQRCANGCSVNAGRDDSCR